MTLLASTWLGLALLLCLFAWLANRRLGLVFLPIGALIAAGAIYIPTGSPRFTNPPKGEYAVVGHKIIPDVAIWVLLDTGGGSDPVYYRLPYSNSQANALQDAENKAAANGGRGVRMKSDGTEGGQTYDGPPPVTADEQKHPEAPAFSFD